MILIADSGSSKTEWRVIDDRNRIHQARTQGLNPYHSTSEVILEVLRKDLLPVVRDAEMKPEDISEVYFYGSGCVPGPPSDRVKNCLQKVFARANAEVNDDLVAVARGLCGKEEGIVSIIGTGSNSGYYDGREISFKIRALGYILGDEGSGAWIGKNLLAMYLRDELPEIISKRLTDRVGPDTGEVFEKVYRTPLANRYLAGFSKFVFQNIKEPRLYQLVYDGFRLFLEHNILTTQQFRYISVDR